MKSHAITFPSGDTTEYYFEVTSTDLRQLATPENTIAITDEHVAKLHGERLSGYRLLIMPAGECAKTLDTIAYLTTQLLKAGAHRKTVLLGIGGGVVTDVVGYLAASFMRGVPAGFVPTTLLGMVDAAIGGKNGVNVGLHKNMLGTVRQPRFVCYDTTFLETLEDEHWASGFAEIIKYGHIADTRILTTLAAADILYFKGHPEKLSELIAGCADIKNKIVAADEQEDGLRRVLNFGHTAGHAFETIYGLPHGYAVGLGMRVATRLSEIHKGLNTAVGTGLSELLSRYGLPLTQTHDAEDVLRLLTTDKKRTGQGIGYVLLEKPGVAVTQVLRPEEIREALVIVQE